MQELNLFKIIKEGTKAIPATKYAIGIAGLVATVALIVSFNIDIRIAIWGTLILIGLMILLVIFAKLSKTASVEFKLPVRIIMWSFTFLFIFISILLTTSVFFRFPVDLQFILVKSEKSIKKESSLIDDSHKVDSSKTERTFSHAFEINYMRLFGAGGVPSLMAILESKTGILKSKDYPGYHIKGSKSSYISDELANFWIDKWQFKDALVLRTELWDKYSNNIQAGFDLYWTALKPKLTEIIEYVGYDNNESGEWDDDLPSNLRTQMHRYIDSLEKQEGIFYMGAADEYKIKLGTRSDDIGYFFSIITNTSEHPLFDISFISKLYTNSVRIQKKNYSAYKSKPDLSSSALNDLTISSIKNFVIDTLKLSSLEPKKSVIWYLGAFKKKDNGLPEFYLTDVYVPSKVEYRLGALYHYDTLRKPYGAKAARAFVPNGWYLQ